MSDYRVVVSTCDKYLPYLKPFIHQFQTYWGKEQQVLVAGFTPPEFDMPNNFKFRSVGNMQDYPINKWSNSIIKLLDFIKDEVLVFMLEDYWITDKVDIEGVQLLVDYAKTHPEVIRIDLTPDRFHTMKYHPEFAGKYDYQYGSLGHLNLVKSKCGAPYTLSMITSVWRKDNILKVLQPDWDPWQVEMQGSYATYLHGEDMIVLGTESAVVPHCVGIRKLPEAESHGKLWYETGFFKPEDKARMQELGILGETGFF